MNFGDTTRVFCPRSTKHKRWCHSERTGPRTFFRSGVVSEESAVALRSSCHELPGLHTEGPLTEVRQHWFSNEGTASQPANKAAIRVRISSLVMCPGRPFMVQMANGRIGSE